MKFSLKDAKDGVGGKGRGEIKKKKSFAGFSLKKKGTSTGEVKKVERKTNSVFESDNGDQKAGCKISITTTDEVVRVVEKEQELVIKPRQDMSSWQQKRREARESKEPEEHKDDDDDAKKEGYKYGMNLVNKTSSDVSRLKSQEVPLLMEDVPEDVEETTMESYKKVPVEKFGLAMLRGMGWEGDAKKEEASSKQDSKLKPRPLLLGLGAKPSPIQLDPSYRVISASYSPVMKVEEDDDGSHIRKKLKSNETSK
ncbi:DEKNAAC102633 [Brettanomyces naardenensis]|uniref:Pre-mRNA-splicing factor n=1 Tax=Brettanomyces naardenensis TaxID=13370 RepID=A0A448YKW2_BRENA|nr:DEKNAAC102633 [Brettanomyces naardenensis]